MNLRFAVGGIGKHFLAQKTSLDKEFPAQMDGPGESGPQQRPGSSSGGIDAIPPAGLPKMRGTLHAVGFRDAATFPD